MSILLPKGAHEVVTAFEEEGQSTRWRAPQPCADPWALFDLP